MRQAMVVAVCMVVLPIAPANVLAEDINEDISEVEQQFCQLLLEIPELAEMACNDILEKLTLNLDFGSYTWLDFERPQFDSDGRSLFFKIPLTHEMILCSGITPGCFQIIIPERSGTVLREIDPEYSSLLTGIIG